MSEDPLLNEIMTDQVLAREIAVLLSLDTDLRERGINVEVDLERRDVRVGLDGHRYTVSVQRAMPVPVTVKRCGCDGPWDDSATCEYDVVAALDSMPADWMINDDYGAVRGWTRSQGLSLDDAVRHEVIQQQRAVHHEIKREQRELDRREMYAMTEDLVTAVIDHFPALRQMQIGSDGIGHTLTDELMQMLDQAKEPPF